jgi:predicted ATPase
MNSTPFISFISIKNILSQKNYNFKINQSQKNHLILTGKNGSGKTTTLQSIYQLLSKAITLTDDRHKNNYLELSKLQNKIFLTENKKIDPDQFLIIENFNLTKDIHNFIKIYIPSRRNFKFKAIQGPTKDLHLMEGSELHQYLINIRTQISYAKEFNNKEKISQLTNHLKNLENQFSKIFEIENLKLIFNPDTIQYKFSHSSGEFDFDNLPDGFLSVLGIWSEIFSAVDRQNKNKKPIYGTVFIDEIETHLHLSLQRKILPFLTEFFPQFQFIVTTHSPAVLSSVEDAVIYDLSSGQRILSEELVGLRYGEI